MNTKLLKWAHNYHKYISEAILDHVKRYKNGF